MFDKLIAEKGFEVLALHHAEAILHYDMEEALSEIEETLNNVSIPIEELISGGGGESKFTQRLRNDLRSKGWEKHNFAINKTVDGVPTESITHEVDHVKQFGDNKIALEIEWNNKDPFFDRDLDNFKRLHSEGAISIGVIITRGTSLQDGIKRLLIEYAKQNRINESSKLKQFYNPTDRQLKIIENAANKLGSFEEGWAHSFVSDKFGEATTHWRKLHDRVRRGVGNPCPLLLIGLPISIVTK